MASTTSLHHRHANPLRSREDLAQLMRDFYEPLRAYRVADGFALGTTAAVYADETAHAEAFLRPLWGLAPLAAGGLPFGHWAEWRATLTAGTDPASPAFWGYITNQDQLAVEMAPLALGLLIAPEEIWEPLTTGERHHLAAWLRSIEQCSGIRNNWIFFRVLVHLALAKFSQPYDHEFHERDLAALDGLFLGDGWYSDGPTSQRDYYIPMAMHFYGLIYARLASAQDPARCERFRQRAAVFAKDYLHWFTPTGDAVPFGRSLSYRFAQAAFWSALVYAGVAVEGWTTGQVKGLLMRHLRWWMAQPILSPDGVLSIGYTYPNLLMSEWYNAPGSPYWAAKSLLILALPSTDPFWSVEEEPLPPRSAIAIQRHAGMIFQHDDARSHTTALASGQHASFMGSASGNKYAKFAYSSKFGFAVHGSDDGVGGGGHDSTLALSEDGQHFRSRTVCDAVEVRDGVLASRWHPWPDVLVETWLAPARIGHVRIHHVLTARTLHACDTGFSVPIHRHQGSDVTSPDALLLCSQLGWSGIRDLRHGAQVGSHALRANLNVLHPRARMPGATRTLSPGDHWLAVAVAGIPDPQAESEIRIWWERLQWVPGGVPHILRDEEIILRADPLPQGVHLTPVPALR